MDFLAVSSPRAPVACDICGKMFSNKANMNRHRISHSDTKTFECRLCLKQFHRKDQLQEHWMIHAKPDGQFDCPVLACEEHFSCFNHLKNHTEQGHSITADTTVNCKHCLVPYKTARRLMIHYHTRDLFLDNVNGSKLDDTMNSANDSMDVSATPEGMALFHQLFNQMPTLQPVQRRKRKAQSVKIQPETQNTSFNNILLDFVNQHCNLNLASEQPATLDNLQTDVAESSNRSTPDSIVSGTATESSNCDESVDFEKREKSPENIDEMVIGNSVYEQSMDTGATIQPALEIMEADKFDCNVCDITYNDRTMYLMHMGFHTLNEPLRCNMCGVVCASTIEFNTHLMYGEHRSSKFDFSKLF